MYTGEWLAEGFKLKSIFKNHWWLSSFFNNQLSILTSNCFLRVRVFFPELWTLAADQTKTLRELQLPETSTKILGKPIAPISRPLFCIVLCYIELVKLVKQEAVNKNTCEDIISYNRKIVKQPWGSGRQVKDELILLWLTKISAQLKMRQVSQANSCEAS